VHRKRKGVAGKPVRISAAVRPLVVVADEVENRLKRFEPAADLLAGRMLELVSGRRVSNGRGGAIGCGALR
jgi:hypothetical protein